MSASHDLQPIPLSNDPLLRVALAAHLARYTGRSRMHAESDLHIYLRWCAERGISPLTARRVDVELFVRWLQEIRRLKPSTVSRRLSMVIGFYPTCVIDAVLEHSPSEYAQILPAFPGRFGSLADARAFCQEFFNHFNHIHRHKAYTPRPRCTTAPPPTSAPTASSS